MQGVGAGLDDSVQSVGAGLDDLVQGEGAGLDDTSKDEGRGAGRQFLPASQSQAGGGPPTIAQ